MFHTCRLFALLMAIDTQVTQLCGKRQVIDGHRFFVGGIDVFGNFDPTFAHRKIVFLLTGHFTCVAAGAILIIY